MNIRLILTSGASALLLFACAPALAAESTNLEPAGITPAHPMYSFDLAWDWARLNVLNRDPDDRAFVGLLQAEERLSELARLKNENDLDALRAHRLSSRYENLLMKFQQRYEQKIALGEDIAELQSALRLRIGNHVDILDEIATASDDDIIEQLRPTREFSEDQEEKLIEEEFDQEKISDNDQQAEAERKLQRADEEVTAADTVLTTQEAAGVDVSSMRASWMRARVFLTQGHDAFLAEQFALAYGLSSQAREIADRIQDALDDDLNDEDPLDDVPEEALEEILEAEEDIREVKSQLANITLTESLRAQILLLLNEAQSNLTAASSALDRDEFVLGYDMALQAQVLTSEAEDLLDTDDDENEEEVKDLAEHARDRIAQADEEIVKAEARIAERQSERKDVVEAATLLNEAKDRLARSREALGASDFVLAYRLAREAKSLANESREGRLFRNVDHGDKNEQESDNGAAPGPDDASDRDDEEEELRDREEQKDEELNEIRDDEDGFEEQRREEEKQRKEEQYEEEKRIKKEEREQVKKERAATREGRNDESRPTPDASTDPEEAAPPDDNDDEDDKPEDGDNEQEDELDEEDGDDSSGSDKEDQEDEDESEDDEDPAEDEEDGDSGGED